MCWLRVKIKAKSTCVCSVLRGGWIIERGNLLCVGYASTRGYASNLILRVAVFGLLSRGILIIERGSLLCRWLRVYAWLRFKIKGNFTAVRSWSTDQRTRQFLLAISLISKQGKQLM